MIYRANKNRISYGEAIGILMLDTFTPFIPGDVGNASTYNFPVRYQTVPGLTFDKILQKDMSILPFLKKAAHNLADQGVRAITADCGFMAVYQRKLQEEVEIPVFLTSLLQLSFISNIISDNHRIGVITASAKSFNQSLLGMAGIDIPLAKLSVKGLEDKKNFYNSAIKETGILEPEKIEKEVVSTAEEMVKEDQAVKAILLECSILPPYGAAVQEATGLPVFDFVTMINYVYSAVVKNRFTGIY